MIFYSDSPVLDFERYEEERDRRLSMFPVCDGCGEHIQSEYKYIIDGFTMCEECARDYVIDNYRERNEI